MKTSRTNLSVAACGLCLMAMVTVANGQSTITRVPTLGGSAVDVRALNNMGTLAGFSRTPSEDQHACVYSGGAMRDLLTLGGATSLANGVNDNGDVVGDSDTSDGFPHAFLFRNGMMTDLGTLPGGMFSTAIAINNVGHVLAQGDASDGYRGFLHRNGTITDLGSLGSGYSSVMGLNNLGDVVGDSMTDMWESHAFVFRNGAMTDLGTLGGSFSRAWAVNDSGVVVGESYDANGALRAFRYSNGVMENLGTLGGNESLAFAINNAGQILGDSLVTGNLHYRSFLFSNGTMTDLGALGGNATTAYDLNNLGHVVGETETASGTVPFLWRDGAMVDLNTLLPPNSGWLLRSAFYISDAGHVVGFGFHNGEFAWYLLTMGADENQPPVANAGVNQTVECGSSTRLDGSASSDPDGDSLTHQWFEGGVLLGSGAMLNVNLALGSHTLTLKVTDTHDATAEASVTIVVQDTTAPSIACPGGQSASAGADCMAAVPNFLSSAVVLDGCTSSGSLAKSQSPAAGTLVGLGTHMVTLTATDASGNSGSCTVSFTVADTTAPTGDCPPAVTVAVGSDCKALVPDFASALMAMDNCTAASALVKTQTPAAGSEVSLGSHNVTLTVTDEAGNKSMCVTTLHVVDNTPPTVVCPASMTVEVRDNCSAPVPDFMSGAAASDNCGDVVLTQSPVAGTLVGRGTHTVTVTATDASGNTASCTTTFDVVDRTAPVIRSVSVNPSVIANADRSMVPVAVSVNATDNCDPSPVSRIVSITSDEPVTGPSDNTSPDWVVGNGLNGQVRAERSNKGNGRVYTLTVVCTDASGNSSTATTTVLVPSKKGGNGNPKAFGLAKLATTKTKKK